MVRLACLIFFLIFSLDKIVYFSKTPHFIAFMNKENWPAHAPQLLIFLYFLENFHPMPRTIILLKIKEIKLGQRIPKFVAYSDEEFSCGSTPLCADTFIVQMQKMTREERIMMEWYFIPYHFHLHRKKNTTTERLKKGNWLSFNN